MSLTPISQKAHDISFAVFRVATLVKNTKLRGELEDAAVNLVSKYEEVFDRESQFYIPNVVDRLERLVMLAESVGEMKPINAGVLKRELTNLQSAITAHTTDAQNSVTGKTDVDISSMFLPSEILTKEAFSNGKAKTKLPNEVSKEEEASDNFTASSELTVRQMAIMRCVREIQFCRLRNIMEAMPNVSERTIRNDIQNLIEKEVVRRIGGGGPSSYFESMEMDIRKSNLPAVKI